MYTCESIQVYTVHCTIAHCTIAHCTRIQTIQVYTLHYTVYQCTLYLCLTLRYKSLSSNVLVKIFNYFCKLYITRDIRLA